MTYNQQQVIYSFSIAANAAGSKKFSNLQAMQDWALSIEEKILTDSTIQGLIGSDWATVWGPIVYAKNTSGASVIADNAMGCYYSPSQNLFIIPIAATNPISSYDWMSEDFAVHTQVEWSSVSPGAPANSGKISGATQTGILTLLNLLKDNNGNTLIQALSSYISSNNIKGAKVAVAGHSLAGALSPCFALYLYENRSQWDPSNSQHMAAYPTAGPTPGDSDFASYYQGLITANGIEYASLYNSLDVVPLAWQSTDIETIPNIYDASNKPVDTPNDEFMGILASVLAINAMALPPAISVLGTQVLPTSVNNYTQISTGRSKLSGTFNGTTQTKAMLAGSAIANALPPTLQTNYGKSLTNLIAFALQAAYQHTFAYYQDIPKGWFNPAYTSLLNIGAFYKEYQNLLVANPPSQSEAINQTSAVIHKFTGLNVGNIDEEALSRAAEQAQS